jgi:hypothetical protein
LAEIDDRYGFTAAIDDSRDSGRRARERPAGHERQYFCDLADV